MPQSIITELNTYANPNKIPDMMRFFKTAKGEYGEGDLFLGISVPNIRKVVKKHFWNMSFDEIKEMLSSKYHEHRMFALLVLVAQYKSKRFSDDVKKEEIYQFYIAHTKQINNWDLIDVTCPHIVGVHLRDKERTILYEFANSDDLWRKRIAIISTFALINVYEYKDTLVIADILFHDSHDLIHKAVGWAIRNVGNKNREVMVEFLKPRYKTMPRTMLRYAIEKLPQEERQRYLKGLV
jgi:3-methyladenine DNA glycosylase AlkD